MKKWGKWVFTVFVFFLLLGPAKANVSVVNIDQCKDQVIEQNSWLINPDLIYVGDIVYWHDGENGRIFTAGKEYDGNCIWRICEKELVRRENEKLDALRAATAPTAIDVAPKVDELVESEKFTYKTHKHARPVSQLARPQATFSQTDRWDRHAQQVREMEKSIHKVLGYFALCVFAGLAIHHRRWFIKRWKGVMLVIGVLLIFTTMNYYFPALAAILSILFCVIVIVYVLFFKLRFHEELLFMREDFRYWLENTFPKKEKEAFPVPEDKKLGLLPAPKCSDCNDVGFAEEDPEHTEVDDASLPDDQDVTEVLKQLTYEEEASEEFADFFGDDNLPLPMDDDPFYQLQTNLDGKWNPENYREAYFGLGRFWEAPSMDDPRLVERAIMKKGLPRISSEVADALVTAYPEVFIDRNIRDIRRGYLKAKDRDSCVLWVTYEDHSRDLLGDKRCRHETRVPNGTSAVQVELDDGMIEYWLEHCGNYVAEQGRGQFRLPEDCEFVEAFIPDQASVCFGRTMIPFVWACGLVS